LNFVIKIAHNYKNKGVDLDDLIQAGNLALDKSIKEFDHTKNIKFISYAVNWIRQAMLQEMAENSRFLKVNTGKTNQLNTINKTVQRMEQGLGRKPTMEEISEETKVSLSELNVLEVLKTQSRLDDPIGENMTVLDTISDDKFGSPDNCDLNSVNKKIINFIDNSSIEKEEHRNILKEYFGMTNGVPHDLTELADRFNYTSERIRQIKNECVKSLQFFTKKEQKSNRFHLTPDMMEV
jgi:RNA polymerase primary sigma factor